MISAEPPPIIATPRSPLSPSAPGSGSGQRRRSGAVTATGRLLARADTRVGFRGHRSASLLERRDEVEELETQISSRAECRIMLVERDRAVGDLLLLVDGQQLGLGQMLDDVAHAQHHDRVADDEYALAAILAREHLRRAA